jgi:flavodoxin
MKSLIVCVSTSHGNTRRVADRMAEVLGAEVTEPESVDPEKLREYDLVGFGSGIYFMAVHARLRNFIRRLPRVDGIRAFTFFTSGAREIPLLDYNKPVRNQLASKGFQVLDSFSCRGFDTVGPFGLIGGINKGRPDEHDLDRAAAFAARLRKRVAGSQAAS